MRHKLAETALFVVVQRKIVLPTRRSPHLAYTLRPDVIQNPHSSTSPHLNLHIFLSYYHPLNVSRSPDCRHQRCDLLLGTSEGSGTCILSRVDDVRLSVPPHSAISTGSLSLLRLIQFTVRRLQLRWARGERRILWSEFLQVLVADRRIHMLFSSATPTAMLFRHLL